MPQCRVVQSKNFKCRVYLLGEASNPSVQLSNVQLWAVNRTRLAQRVSKIPKEYIGFVTKLTQIMLATKLALLELVMNR